MAAPRASRGRTACRSSPGPGRARTSAASQKRDESGVSTSSMRISSPSRQHAELELRVGEDDARRARTPRRRSAYRAIASVARPRRRDARGRPSDATSRRTRCSRRAGPGRAFVGRREDRLGQPVALAQAGRQRDAAHGARRPVLLPAGAREVAADDAPRSAGPRRAADHHPAAQLVGDAPSLGQQRAGSSTGSRRRAGGSGRRRPSRANQNRDSPVSTRPLSGIGGRQDHVEGARSGRTRRAAAGRRRAAYRSRTLPDRRNAAQRAASAPPVPARPAASSASSRAMTAGHVAQERRVVEAGVQLGQAAARRHLRVGREQLPQRPALVGGAERGPLDDRVGVLAGQAAALDQRDEDARRSRGGPRPRSMFSRIRSGRTTSPRRGRSSARACSRAGSSRRAGSPARRELWLMSRSCHRGWFSSAVWA